MKQLILMMTVLLSFVFNAQATTPMAQTVLAANITNYEKALVKLYNKEAKIKGSPIANYIAALKADPDNEDQFIDDTIEVSDIIRLESGASAGTFEINYLIVIRAGFKSYTNQVGFLKATSSGSIEDDFKTYLAIIEPAKVTIE